MEDLKPKEILERLVEIGKNKMNLKIYKMLILSFLAGIYISIGGSLYTMITQDIKIGTGFSQFLGGSVFSVGLIFVVLTGAELFTGNNLILVTILKKEETITKLFKNWIVVFFGNFIGSIFYAYLIFLSKLYEYNSYSWGIRAISIANNKISLDFLEALSRGILCNVLVCLAVLMAIGSKSYISKIFSIYFPIMAFVASGFEHSVANMYFVPIGIFLKSDKNLINLINFDISNLNFINFLIKNLLPVTIGNLIGGSIIIGFLYYLVYLKD